MAIASIAFYSWWDWHYTAILLVSVIFNFSLGSALLRQKTKFKYANRWLLRFAIAANLLVLGYFKYMNFFISTGETIFNTHMALSSVALPVGISFFTFTQIAFLVDTTQGKAREPDFTHYLLFVTYFPHLIAGPILHHSEMMPQFRNSSTYAPRADAIEIGRAHV